MGKRVTATVLLSVGALFAFHPTGMPLWLRIVHAVSTIDTLYKMVGWVRDNVPVSVSGETVVRVVGIVLMLAAFAVFWWPLWWPWRQTPTPKKPSREPNGQLPSDAPQVVLVWDPSVPGQWKIENTGGGVARNITSDAIKCGKRAVVIDEVQRLAVDADFPLRFREIREGERPGSSTPRGLESVLKNCHDWGDVASFNPIVRATFQYKDGVGRIYESSCDIHWKHVGETAMVDHKGIRLIGRFS